MSDLSLSLVQKGHEAAHGLLSPMQLVRYEGLGGVLLLLGLAQAAPIDLRLLRAACADRIIGALNDERRIA